jgi:aminopeptidase N
LENQTRPIYSKDFFGDQVAGDAVVVHELAHQW